MDSDDQHSNNNSDLNELQSTQERRRLLEAYQAGSSLVKHWHLHFEFLNQCRNKEADSAFPHFRYITERALSKSLLRASVRPRDHSSRPSHPLSHSVAGYHAGKSITVKDVLQSKETLRDGGANQQQQPQHQHQPAPRTKSIIQHYNALSRTSKHVSTLLGVRRHGTVAHKVEKKPILTRPGSSSAHSSVQGRGSDSTDYIIPTGAPTSILDADHTKGLQSTKESMTSSLWSSRTSASKAADTFGTRSIRLDRATTISSTKKQEEIYLSQARLMQWYFMNKRAVEHFSAQEKSAEVILITTSNGLKISFANETSFSTFSHYARPFFWSFRHSLSLWEGLFWRNKPSC